MIFEIQNHENDLWLIVILYHSKAGIPIRGPNTSSTENDVELTGNSDSDWSLYLNDDIDAHHGESWESESQT